MQFQQVVKLWLLFMVNLSLVLLYAECEKSQTRVQIREPDVVLHVQVSSHSLLLGAFGNVSLTEP